MILPVVLCGGSGTRLWPMSRRTFPKQFVSLIDDRSLFQLTLQRLSGVNEAMPPCCICNETHRFLVKEQAALVEMQLGKIILEPVGRNTAPAIAVAALHAISKGEDPVLLVLPADHLLSDTAHFHEALQKGVMAAAVDRLVTFGVVPSYPATGYGYIRCGNAEKSAPFYSVEAFEEKPDIEKAEQYLKTGGYFWNSGIFMFRASCYLAALERYAPDIYASCVTVTKAWRDDDAFLHLPAKSFALCRSDSIDYAILEKSDQVATVPLSCGWNDLGAWTALATEATPDGDGNVCVGDVVTENVQDSYIHSSHRLVTAIGLRDHLVVETRDAVLVAHKDYAQDVKHLVATLKAAERTETELPSEVYRPWGTYETVERGPRFLVKRIRVRPGASLSLQQHQHRSEHWVVVAGLAEVTRNDEVFVLRHDESTYLPQKTIHRLKNVGDDWLEIVEVQVGDYLSEDDITRFADHYGREKVSEDV